MAADADNETKLKAAQAGRQRLDKWLWIARFAKTRSLAQQLIVGGKVRVNKVRVIKPSFEVKAADVLTMSLGPRLRLIEVVRFGDRRGAAQDAQLLYTDLAPPRAPGNGAAQESENKLAVAKRLPGSGRPTKRDRRQIDRLKSQTDDQ